MKRKSKSVKRASELRRGRRVVLRRLVMRLVKKYEIRSNTMGMAAKDSQNPLLSVGADLYADVAWELRAAIKEAK